MRRNGELSADQKRGLFARAITRRVRNLERDIAILAKTGDKRSFEYDLNDVDAVFARIETAIRRCRDKFEQQMELPFELPRKGGSGE